MKFNSQRTIYRMNHLVNKCFKNRNVLLIAPDLKLVGARRDLETILIRVGGDQIALKKSPNSRLWKVMKYLPWQIN